MHGSEAIVIFLNRMTQILANLMNIRAILYYSQTTGMNYTNVVNEFLLLRLQLVISILQRIVGPQHPPAEGNNPSGVAMFVLLNDAV